MNPQICKIFLKARNHSPATPAVESLLGLTRRNGTPKFIRKNRKKAAQPHSLGRREDLTVGQDKLVTLADLSGFKQTLVGVKL